MQPGPTANHPRILNFRDVAELAADRVRGGMVFRAARPDRLQEGEPGEWGIRTIIDLPESGERHKACSFTGVRTLHLPMTFDKAIKQRLAREMGRRGDTETLHHVFRDGYLDLLENQKDVVARVFAVFDDPAAFPLLLHCRAGKDRTGVIVALLLLLLGVEEEAIMADYLRSNRDYSDHQERRLRLFRCLSLGLADVRKLAWLGAAHRECLEAVFQQLCSRYGDVACYLESAGVSREMQVRIRASLGVPCP